MVCNNTCNARQGRQALPPDLQLMYPLLLCCAEASLGDLDKFIDMLRKQVGYQYFATSIASSLQLQQLAASGPATRLGPVFSGSCSGFCMQPSNSDE